MSVRVSATDDPRIARFWRDYLEVLRLFRILGKAHPWHRRHVEAFIHDSMRLFPASGWDVEMFS
ncbi:hypothetical protein [endosymbiont of unidentified scaly snail isolate Monju]|uniref:hypothetical protein n=1 Tax=endosymbiont of unidentified scaly snail isolate Monju TaxID=1248727 RepID=UPI0011DE58A5|nr:hypothetical protein [endosymbiont of unidentified scaly snail isolate Monju]